MKTLLIQIVGSSVVLGLMAGAVALHHAHIKGARELAGRQEWSAHPAGGPIREVAGELPVSLGLPALSKRDTRDGIEVQTVAAMQLVLEELRDLRQENRSLRTQVRSESDALRDQVSEFNRDITELQLRVDSHSESFRPLRAAPDYFPRREPEYMVLPPKR